MRTLIALLAVLALAPLLLAASPASSATKASTGQAKVVEGRLALAIKRLKSGDPCHTNNDGVTACNTGSTGDITVDPQSGSVSSATIVEFKHNAEGSVTGMDSNDTVNTANGSNATISGAGGTVNAGVILATACSTNPPPSAIVPALVGAQTIRMGDFEPEEGQVLNGRYEVDRFWIRKGQTIWVDGNCEIYCAGVARIDGRLLAFDAEALNTEDAPTISIQSSVAIDVPGLVAGGRGRDHEGAIGRAGAGTFLHFEAPIVYVDGQLLAGDGGIGGLAEEGGRGGDAVVDGYMLVREWSESHFSLVGGVGGRGGDGGGLGGLSGAALARTTEALESNIDELLPQIKLAVSSFMDEESAPGQACADGMPGGDGGNSMSPAGASGGMGLSGTSSSPSGGTGGAGRASQDATATDGLMGTNGGDCCPGAGGKGGRGGKGGDAVTGMGGTGGPGGMGYLGTSPGGMGGMGANGGNAKGGRAGSGGSGGKSGGAGGAPGTPGSATGGMPGPGGAGGAGTPMGPIGSGGSGGALTQGGSGTPGNIGGVCSPP